jgi:protein phosphatase 2C
MTFLKLLYNNYIDILLYKMLVYMVSLKGLRNSNEDMHTISINHNKENTKYAEVNVYGVYDGHGGKFVSTFLSNNLPIFFLSQKVVYPLKKDYVHTVYNKIQEILFTKYEDKATESGSTCLIVCHFKKNGIQYLNILNTGDSRCVLCNSDNIAVPLTKDHKPDWPEEKNRILKLGGTITNDDGTPRIGSLSVSRAFGDKDESQYVTHLPDIFLYTLTDTDRFIIIACDGLWDVMSSDIAINLVIHHCYDADMKRINHEINIARKLAEKGIELGSTVNITCIGVFFST